jgi:hypothetical protein
LKVVSYLFGYLNIVDELKRSRNENFTHKTAAITKN